MAGKTSLFLPRIPYLNYPLLSGNPVRSGASGYRIQPKFPDSGYPVRYADPWWTCLQVENWGDKGKKTMSELYSRNAQELEILMYWRESVTPLCRAIMCENVDAVEFLLSECHANIDGPPVSGVCIWPYARGCSVFILQISESLYRTAFTYQLTQRACVQDSTL